VFGTLKLYAEYSIQKRFKDVSQIDQITRLRMNRVLRGWYQAMSKRTGIKLIDFSIQRILVRKAFNGIQDTL
jgi:hypothetical protein